MKMSPGAQVQPIFRLTSPFKDPVRRRMFSVVGGALEKLFALDQISNVYYAAAQNKEDRRFADKLLKVLNISYEISDVDLARIPKTGPIVVVANHPFGGIEGVLLCAILQSVRPDVKLMANFLLERIPDMRDVFIYVDPFGGSESARVNVKPLKESLQWLRQGGMLGIFPSGEVSHLNLKRGGVSDPEWSTTVARLVRKTEAAVLPVFFRGQNSALFQMLGMVHPRLRTAMLCHEVMNKQNRSLEVRVGNAIPFNRLEPLTDDRELMNYVRMRTYHLNNRRSDSPRRKFSFPVKMIGPTEEPIEAAQDAALLKQEFDGLPAAQVLIESGSLAVAYASATQIPRLLRELGRLREITFRQVGEGTGKAVDLDRFDDVYLHLIVWNREKSEVVGAYRLGQTDLILKSHSGVKGLYTSTLFKYKRRLLEHISPALEMGRSFVRVEYQKSFSGLLLLWKGLAQFVCRFPQYKILFGPVSINNEYQTSSRLLLVAFLKVSNFAPYLSRLVKARRPMRANPLKAWKLRKSHAVVNDLAEVESLIADIETDLKGIPILLKQYLKLGGKLLGFNIDPDFSNVLDGLILVDLTKTDPAVLAKYMGRENAVKFLAYHGITPPG